jgi:hypothetical protein
MSKILKENSRKDPFQIHEIINKWKLIFKKWKSDFKSRIDLRIYDLFTLTIILSVWFVIFFFFYKFLAYHDESRKLSILKKMVFKKVAKLLLKFHSPSCWYVLTCFY